VPILSVTSIVHETSVGWREVEEEPLVGRAARSSEWFSRGWAARGVPAASAAGCPPWQDHSTQPLPSALMPAGDPRDSFVICIRDGLFLRSVCGLRAEWCVSLPRVFNVRKASVKCAARPRLSVLRTTTGWFAISMPYCPRSRPWRISALLLVGFTMVWLFATRVSADSQATGPSAWPSHMVPAICGPCTAPPQWANRSRSGESTATVAIDRLRIATGILAWPAVVPRGRWFTHAVAPASARGGYLHWVLRLSVCLQL
jgi:hypothetical protein